ncbi:bifunctional 2-polyprenyl-6-hydroxyphenol methylase/3-demethylubiquinol 3-O-methyltransferase UbiG [Streptomyces rimosus]|uniref:class I SAM-dependent methyltransferase n=1 Tax=Streptomyces rimosus TaxID=1927 RepID=UPI00099C12C4|nr:class I SAM-dependent methyltransferase [Streptomyces rimosus]
MTSQFDGMAALHERSIDELPFRRHIEMPSVLAAAGGVEGRRVLDLGCGSGLYARFFARNGAGGVLGVDRSPGMIAHARHREEVEPLGVRYLVHDEATAQSLTGAFDLAVSVYALSYAATPAALTRLCAAARATLAPGGRFVAATLNPDLATVPHYYRPYGFDLTVADPHLRDGDPVGLHGRADEESFQVTAYYWSREAHERALAEAGFTDIAWQPPRTAADGSASLFARYLAAPHVLAVSARVAGGTAQR